MNLETEIEQLFHPFSISYFNEAAAHYDFSQATEPAEVSNYKLAPYNTKYSIQQQRTRSKQIYKIIKDDLVLALTSPNPYIRTFALLIQNHA